MKLILENWRNFLNLTENFYLASDTQKKNPISLKILNAILSKLPNSKQAKNLKQIEASGAEGIVFSLDDYRVIKLFFSIQNALKATPFFSKKLDFTANIYSAGKINLDLPVIYYREKSSYAKTTPVAIKTIYYLVMERVVPDEETYNSIELEYDRYVRLSKIQFKELIELFSLQDEGIKNRIKQIISNFLLDKNLISKEQDPFQYLNSIDKKQRNILITKEFSLWSKQKTKEFVFIDNFGKPLLLKNFLLNDIGVIKTVNFETKNLKSFLFSRKEFSFVKNNKSVINNFKEIEELLIEIILKSKIPWSDIHKGQFGRNKQGKLIALDLGIKQNTAAQSFLFNKNVSSVSLKSDNPTIVSEQSKENKKILNFWDFDSTLFNTDDDKVGKSKWEKIYKKQFPYIGWFSKEESLDPALDIQPVQNVINMYRQISNNSVNIILSDRQPNLESAMSKILKLNNIKADHFLLNAGKNKTQRIEDFFEKNPDFDEINVFDDNEQALKSHLKFKKLYNIWRPELIINLFQVESGNIKKYG